ncbi:MAG: DNA-binding protein [Elusimicrobia bacterium]|nr:DNA-binding protein [Elusimicrobiota bacterium]
MKRIAAGAAVLGIMASLAVTAEAQWRRRDGGGWGMSGAYARHFDPKTVETLEGEVSKVETAVPKRGMSRGIHLVLKTAKEEVSVHLGPQWFLERQEFSVEPKDRLTVTGSRVDIEGEVAVIASELRKGDMTLVLRDAQGYPVWSGWRRNR